MKNIEEDLTRHENVQPSSATMSSPEKSILVVSVDDGLSPLLEAMCREQRFRVIAAVNAPAARDVLRHHVLSLIVVDVDGTHASTEEALDFRNRIDVSVPIILIVESTRSEEAIEAVEKGVYDFVERPLDERRLRSAVLRGLECSDQRRFRDRYRQLLENQVQERTIEIRRRKDFFQAILDSSTLVSIVLTDLEQNVLFWNSGARNIFGYTPEEMIGSKITKLYPGDEISEDTVTNLRDMVRCTQGIVYGKMRQIAKDGSNRYVSLALTPMLGSEGTMEGTVGVGLDVTEEVRLNEELRASFQQIERIQEISIFMLAKVAESRDQETGSHLLRIREFGRSLCKRLSEKNEYRSLVSPLFVDNLVRSSVLHDIGKVAIPDSVLMSDEVFTPDQRRIMMQHARFGGDALDEAVKSLGEESFLSIGREIAYYHHEHWDGSGYPFGLTGEEIPLSARIVAIADVYDALTTKRRYKKSFSHEEACALILENKGKQFDPDLVNVFMEVEKEFRIIRNRLEPTL